MKFLRHCSLNLDLVNVCSKMFMENQIFVFPDHYFNEFSIHLNLHYIIR